MNRMGEVLDLLGIEDYSVNGQEYDLVRGEHGAISKYPYRRIGNILLRLGSREIGCYDELIKGNNRLIPRPWVPKEGDNYYITDVTSVDGYIRFPLGRIDIILRLSKRSVKFYRTKEEVEAEVERLYKSGEWER